jgi:phenylacetate-coenzyme A ligase PaaK-like adenylate-forming protein
MPDTINPLDPWTAAHLGCAGPMTQAQLLAAQMHRLRETVAWAKARSPFYRHLLAAVHEFDLQSPADLRRLPITTAADLIRNDPPLLCVSQDEISHVVTLDTSGTTGAPKRLFFTAEDLAATTDFFRCGMSLFTRPGDGVLILFPGERPGSVGDLLAAAVERLGARPILAGWPKDAAATAALLARERPAVVAGAPVAVLAVAQHSTALGPQAVRSVLLSADHVAASLRRRLAKLWGCEVFEHYGMTEMGLGGGVDCGAHAGYHMREGDLLVEVINCRSGEPAEPGEIGEVAFTTLGRRGMPLIRYCSGDLSRLVPEPCACGSPLMRLEPIRARNDSIVRLGAAGSLTMGLLDEVIFAFDQVTDFLATWLPGPPPALRIEIVDGGEPLPLAALEDALAHIPVIAKAITSRGLQLTVGVAAQGRKPGAKRRIAVETSS